MAVPAPVDLYWIPLGAGASVEGTSGKLFEAVSALIRRRRRCDLYHSALEITVPAGRFTIEMTPVPDLAGADVRGVVSEGAVGTRCAPSVFHYEIQARWRERCRDILPPAAPFVLIGRAWAARGFAWRRRVGHPLGHLLARTPPHRTALDRRLHRRDLVDQDVPQLSSLENVTTDQKVGGSSPLPARCCDVSGHRAQVSRDIVLEFPVMSVCHRSLDCSAANRMKELLGRS